MGHNSIRRESAESRTRMNRTGWIGMLGIMVVLIAGGGCERISSKEQGGHWTRLHSAADAGDVDEVNAILRTNPQLVNADDGDGHTPMHVAADRGHADVVKVLLA